MDDYGNLYQTEKWAFTAEEWAYSVATFGWLDNVSVDICLFIGVHFSRIDI